jgi:hypothetical protein
MPWSRIKTLVGVCEDGAGTIRVSEPDSTKLGCTIALSGELAGVPKRLFRATARQERRRASGGCDEVGPCNKQFDDGQQGCEDLTRDYGAGYGCWQVGSLR